MTRIPQPFAPPVYGQRDGEYVSPASEQPMSDDEARAWWRFAIAKEAVSGCALDIASIASRSNREATAAVQDVARAALTVANAVLEELEEVRP